MSNISFFGREAFLNINPSEPLKLRKKPIKTGHVMRVSSMIRMDQIAEKIGARINPTEEYENDICIYLKPMVRAHEDFKFEGKAYLDIVDGWSLTSLLKKHPEVKVIGCSKQDCVSLKTVLKNEVVFIPQHHANFERVRRNRNGITTVGVIGTKGAFPFIPQEIRQGLKEREIELIEFSKFFKREDIVNFYQKIDVQLVWRPYRKRLANPLKLVNAASFGIPTIALDEPYFRELENSYLPVNNVEEFFSELNRLEDPEVYKSYSDKCIIKSEEYHIDNIVKLYEQLT